MKTKHGRQPCRICRGQTTADVCRACVEGADNGDDLTDAELDALIASRRPTMPPDDERIAANSDRKVIEVNYDGYVMPRSRLVRFDRRHNGMRVY